MVILPSAMKNEGLKPRFTTIKRSCRHILYTVRSRSNI